MDSFLLPKRPRSESHPETRNETVKVQTQHSSSQSPWNKKILGMNLKTENQRRRFPLRMLMLRFVLQVILATILKRAQ